MCKLCLVPAVTAPDSASLSCGCARVRNHKGYEEVLVPAVKAGAPAAGEVVVRIEQLEEWAQLAFEGYKCAPVPHSQGVMQIGAVLIILPP